MSFVLISTTGDTGVDKRHEGNTVSDATEPRNHPFAFPCSRVVTMAILVVLSIIGLVITYIVAYSACPSTYHLSEEYDAPLHVPSVITNMNKNTTFYIALFGDSLINYPWHHYDLPLLITSYLPNFHLNFYNYGKDGDKISGMMERVDIMLTDTLPHLDAVILFWDSDVSDIDEYDMSQSSIDQLRMNYRDDVSYTLSRIKTRCPSCYIALAGPEMIGEGPLFPVRTHPIVYYNKLLMLDQYRVINTDVCAQANIPYINMRQAFVQSVPSSFHGYSGCLTIDGEHESPRGATIVAKMFASALLLWLSKGETTGTNDDMIILPPNAISTRPS